jgi:eukaryotic-like serine/threonine-protein kinase
MTSTARESAIAPEIGKYHLIAELARGGMGNVFLAVAQGPGGFSKLLVVKELKPELCDDPTYVAMFRDEARLAARLIHPNIVQTNEVGSDGPRHYMVMEFLDGRSLHRIGKRLAGVLPIGAHLRVIGEALLGLHHAHELCEFDGMPLGVVHRDVSPLNIFVTFNGQAKVVDFGIAKTIDSSLETKMGVLKGRVAYMAPEQAKGSLVDRRADIYSVGVMLWEAAADRRLWPAMSEVQILARLLREGPPLLRTVRPDAPEELELICARAMAWNRDERYATAAHLLDDLEGHLARRQDTMTMREIGATVAQAFAEERHKMNAVIEETLTRVQGGPRSGVMPTFQAQTVGTPTNASLMGDRASLASPRLLTPSALHSGSLSSRSAPATTATLGSPSPVEMPRLWTTKRAAILTSLGGVLLLGATLLGASLLGATLRGGAKPAQPAAAAVSMAAPPAVHPEPELVNLLVHASPASAQITIDGATVVTNPFRARYPKDSQTHHITASADGYDTKLEDVTFATDVSIDVSLNRRKSAPSHPAPVLVNSGPPHAAKRPPITQPAASASAEDLPPPIAPARPESSQAVGRAPLRPIATSNPYLSQ